MFSSIYHLLVSIWHPNIELKTKSLFTTTSNVLPFKFKCLTAICCCAKMIPINPVNLSHLYDKFLMKKHNLTFFVFLRVFFYKGQLFVNLLSGTHFWSVPTPCIMALGQLAQSSRSRKFFRIKIPATYLWKILCTYSVRSWLKQMRRAVQKQCIWSNYSIFQSILANPSK